MTRVLTWNVAGRVKGCIPQFELVRDHGADVVCLQEITPTSREAWVRGLEDSGYHVLVSPYLTDPQGSRRLTTLIAAREPVAPAPEVPGLPWPERHLAVRTAIDGVETEIHTLHAPLSQKPDRVKVRTLEALFDAVAEPRDDGIARIVTGDLNTPSYESREGEIQTFARTRSGRIRPEYGERHDRAELLLIGELPKRGWSDAFRALHGYEARDRSFMFLNRKFGWRLDHILLSPELTADACEYVHDWRENGHSDHSAMWADVRIRETTP